MKMTTSIKSALSRLFVSADDELDEQLPPLPEVPKSESKQYRKNLFREAVAFAKEEIKDPKRKKFYAERAKKRQSAFHVAVSMFMKFTEPRYASGF